MSDDVDEKNKLNELSNSQWLRETKSFWLTEHALLDDRDAEVVERFTNWLRDNCEPAEAERLLDQIDRSFVYSTTPPRSELKALHPATFSERDIERLIELFTKTEQRVLDPFVGSGSTLIACMQTGRHGVGIELSERWADIARQRLEEETDLFTHELEHRVITGDAVAELEQMEENSFDFVVTSPPYWSILTKKAGLKAKAEREDKGLPTKYSEDDQDLGNIEDYDEFLGSLAEVFEQCGRVLKPERYMAVIVSDFRHGPKFYLFHADLARHIERVGPQLKGVTILAQDNKNLYPFGVPHCFVSNIHHQYILIFQKTDSE